METMLIAIVLSLLIFVVAVWAIGRFPLPGAETFPVKPILYVFAALFLIIYWLRFLPGGS